MYVDKRLSGIKAVQTFSRLNRTYTSGDIEKTATFILDFVNDADDILEAFLPYYKTASLAEVTDPDQVHSLQNALDEAGIYDNSDIERFMAEYAKVVDVRSVEKRTTMLKAALDPIVVRYNDWLSNARRNKDVLAESEALLFRSNLKVFVRSYGFLVAALQLRRYGDGKAVHFLRFAFPAYQRQRNRRAVPPREHSADAPQDFKEGRWPETRPRRRVE